MAKRYHQSKRDRMHERMGEDRHLARMRKDRRDESEGMDRYLGREHRADKFNDEMRRDKDFERHSYKAHNIAAAEYYAGPDPRRRQEIEDAGMIHEDHTAVANLPQNVIMRPYPRPRGYTPEDLDDTLEGVDNQMGYDNMKKLEHFYPKKV